MAEVGDPWLSWVLFPFKVLPALAAQSDDAPPNPSPDPSALPRQEHTRPLTAGTGPKTTLLLQRIALASLS
jgi:hypothetical protein